MVMVYVNVSIAECAEPPLVSTQPCTFTTCATVTSGNALVFGPLSEVPVVQPEPSTLHAGVLPSTV